MTAGARAVAEAYIVEALRTPGGRARKGGQISVHPADLGATVLDALVGRTGVDPAAIEDVIVGCVTQAGEQVGASERTLRRVRHHGRRGGRSNLN